MITRQQAIDLLTSDDLIGIGMEADAVRRKLHPHGVVSYAVEGEVGLSTTIEFLHGEDVEERINQLERLRRVQEESGSVTVCKPGLSEGSAVEYLKLLAISRIYLENISNIQTSSEVASGLKICQIALRFGANDISGPTEEELRRLIRDAGFVPKRRDASFRTLFLN